MRSNRVSHARTIEYLEQAESLTRSFPTRAATCAYSLPSHPHRLVSDDLEHLDVPMTRLILDVDDPEAHRTGASSSEEWRAGERAKIAKLRTAHPGPFGHFTPAGYRLYYTLARPFIICDAVDVERWRASYLAIVADLAERFGIVADPSGSRWGQCFDLPRCTREGGAPERPETFGDPFTIGKWKLRIVEPAALRPRGEAIGSASESVIGRALVERGEAGRERKGGAILDVRCPYYDEHTPHPALDGSTVVHAPTGAKRLGWLQCSHASCSARPQADYRRKLGIEVESDGVQRVRAMLDEEQAGDVVRLVDVEAAVHEAIGLASPPRLVCVVGTLGSGKTRGTIRAAVASDRPFVIATPRHDLGDEVAAQLIKAGERVDRRRGMLSVVGANREPLCRQHVRATELQAAGGSVRSLCVTCPHQDGCPARHREDKQRIIVAPHQLADVAVERNDPAALDAPTLVVDESPALLAELTVTLADLDEVPRILRSDILDRTWARQLAAFVHALRITVSEPDATLVEACKRVDRAARREPKDLLTWSATPRATAEAIRTGKLHMGRDPRFARKDLLGLSPDAWATVVRAMKVLRPILAAAAHADRIAWRADGFAVHVLTREAELLTRGNAIVLDATPSLAMLGALCTAAGIDLVTVTLRVPDGAKHTREILYSTRASRSALAPGKVARWKEVRPILARALDAVRDVQGRILLVTFKLIADGIRKGKLADLLAPFEGRIDVAHYGAIRGLNAWRENEACITVGDPWPELGSVREQAKVMGVDAEAHLRQLARAELAQAHGRLRDPSRSTKATHVHLGAVAPQGWTTKATTLHVTPDGRPRTTSSVTTEELRTWCAGQKSKRAAAKTLGLPIATLLRCLAGQALPAKARTPHRGFRISPATKSDPVSSVGSLNRGFRITPPVSDVRVSRSKRAAKQAVEPDPDADNEEVRPCTYALQEAA